MQSVMLIDRTRGFLGYIELPLDKSHSWFRMFIPEKLEDVTTANIAESTPMKGFSIVFEKIANGDWHTELGSEEKYEKLHHYTSFKPYNAPLPNSVSLTVLDGWVCDAETHEKILAADSFDGARVAYYIKYVQEKRSYEEGRSK